MYMYTWLINDKYYTMLNDIYYCVNNDWRHIIIIKLIAHGQAVINIRNRIYTKQVIMKHNWNENDQKCTLNEWIKALYKGHMDMICLKLPY